MNNNNVAFTNISNDWEAQRNQSKKNLEKLKPSNDGDITPSEAASFSDTSALLDLHRWIFSNYNRAGEKTLPPGKNMHDSFQIQKAELEIKPAIQTAQKLKDTLESIFFVGTQASASKNNLDQDDWDILSRNHDFRKDDLREMLAEFVEEHCQSHARLRGEHPIPEWAYEINKTLNLEAHHELQRAHIEIEKFMFNH